MVITATVQEIHIFIFGFFSKYLPYWPADKSRQGRCFSIIYYSNPWFRRFHLLSDISETPSTISGEQLGSADIQPLTIQCALGNMSPEDSIIVEVLSYAFYETFDKVSCLDTQLDKENLVTPCVKSIVILYSLNLSATRGMLAARFSKEINLYIGSGFRKPLIC